VSWIIKKEEIERRGNMRKEGEKVRAGKNERKWKRGESICKDPIFSLEGL
jgi:hypothetical protein